MDKTCIVTVQRRVAHPKYGKYMTKRSKFVVHDAKNECQIGDRVEIVESRPLSRHKHWKLDRLLVRAETIKG
jgi:small subunit ribosomal protein S17